MIPTPGGFTGLLPEAVLDAVERSGARATGRVLALNSLENRVYDESVRRHLASALERTFIALPGTAARRDRVEAPIPPLAERHAGRRAHGARHPPPARPAGGHEGRQAAAREELRRDCLALARSLH